MLTLAVGSSQASLWQNLALSFQFCSRIVGQPRHGVLQRRHQRFGVAISPNLVCVHGIPHAVRELIQHFRPTDPLAQHVPQERQRPRAARDALRAHRGTAH